MPVIDHTLHCTLHTTHTTGTHTTDILTTEYRVVHYNYTKKHTGNEACEKVKACCVQCCKMLYRNTDELGGDKDLLHCHEYDRRR